MKLPDRGPLYGVRRSFLIEDQFPYYVDLDQWTKLVVDAGSSVAHLGDGVPPTVLLTTGATDNNECMLRSTNESFLMAADKPIFGSVRLQYAEANTDDANIFCGFINAAGANLMVDDGAGPKTSASGFGIYKVDGGTVWRCFSSKGATQTTTASTKTAGGTAYQVLEFMAQPINPTDLEVSFWVDGVLLVDTNNNIIKHTVVFASATEMHFVPCYVKAGGATSETPEVSSVYSSQLY
jgi:hypothetical protein